MWWDKQTLLKETKRALESRRLHGRSLYLGIAHTADKRVDLQQIRTDTTEDTMHMRSISQLQCYLENNTHNGLKYQ